MSVNLSLTQSWKTGQRTRIGKNAGRAAKMVASVGRMTFSVHSMAAVNSALQHMSMLQRESAAVHTRIATGLKVGSASDDGTVWAMAHGMTADNESRVSALTSIDLGTGVVETALAAAEGISDLMVEMKGKLVAATDTTLDEQSWRSGRSTS